MTTYQIALDQNIKARARDYAHKAAQYTSKRHDCHTGGLANKEEKMYIGKLGEFAFEKLCSQFNLPVILDTTPYNQADAYDMVIQNQTIDVKTSTYHNPDLIVYRPEDRNYALKDIMILAYLDQSKNYVTFLGWATANDFNNPAIRQTKDFSYGLRWYIAAGNLRPMQDFFSIITN